MLLSMIFTKLQRTKHDMKQFINRNNAYGSKVVSHTITKSLINQGDPMAWKTKQASSGHQGLGLRSKI